jgi:hypothetical protein
MDTELLPALVRMSPLCFYFHDWDEPEIPGILWRKSWPANRAPRFI